MVPMYALLIMAGCFKFERVLPQFKSAVREALLLAGCDENGNLLDTSATPAV